MVQCEYCINYSNGRCTDPSGIMYDKKIDDPYREIDCPAYIDKGFAGAMSPDFDDEFFDMF